MWLPLITFVVASAGFAIGAAGGATWMDPGELAAASWQLGVAHPPGHPAYVMLGKLAALFPLGEIGFRISLLSSVAMGAAAASVVAVAQLLVPRERVAAALAVLLLVLAPAVVFNARRVEVYGPTLALTGWSLWAALMVWRADRPQPRHISMMALGLGMAAAIHPLIAAVVGLPAAIAVAIRLRARLARLAAPALGLGLLALASYALLPIRANAETRPELLWGDPATAGAAYDVISGAAYQKNFEIGTLGERLGGALAITAEGPGLPLLFAGLVGLLFGAVTRLRGAGLLLAIAATTLLGAATQGHLNPDLRAYMLPALMACAAGAAIAAGAVARLAGDSLPVRLAAQAVVVGGVGLFGFCGDPGPDQPSLGDPADLAALFDQTVGAMPPGPGVYLTRGDVSLFAAFYAQMVAGDRPDIAVASIELSRDLWFVTALDARVPELHVPFIDDGRAGNIATRMAVINMRMGHPVGADVPAFGQLLPTHARPQGLGYRLGLEPGDAGPGQEARPPPRWRGHLGHKIAHRSGWIRGQYESRRGRLGGAATAAGLAEPWVEAVSVVPAAGRPALLAQLPKWTPVMIHAEWLDRLLLSNLLWRAGGPPVAVRGPIEQKLLGIWQRMLGGDFETAEAALARLELRADEVTTRALMDLERPRLAERHLRAMLARRGELPGALALLGSVLGTRGDPPALAEAEALFARSIELDPDNAESHTRLGLIRAKRGDLDGAVAAWRRALALAPGRPDVIRYLEKAAAERGALP